MSGVPGAPATPRAHGHLEAGAGEAVARELGARLLVAEARPDARELLGRILSDEGYAVHTVARGDDALQAMDRELYDVILLDLALPGVDGASVLAAAPALQTDAQFIALTSEEDTHRAVEAMKLGAYDVVSPPLRARELLAVVAQALRDLERRRAGLHVRESARAGVRSRLIGGSPAMERLFALMERVAPTRATVLITGETGTGKELVARALHELSDRAGRPFVAINCSALPETLLESELFGHMKGSFTGAIANKRGQLEEAAGGTLFLDEVSTISQHIQVKLLRVLQDHMVQRIGGAHPVAVDFRLLAATNVALADEVAAGRFREDLFYRLNVFALAVPPLRERAEDIPLLADHFRARVARENGLAPPPFGRRAIRRMLEYDWPGNVRELENAVERAVILHAGARSLPFEPPPRRTAHARGAALPIPASRRPLTLEALERAYILRVLGETHGNRLRAATALGIDRRTLHRKLRRWRADGGLGDAPDDAPPDELADAR
ncbi:MAG TPA: sigma-54 dependent transcriptional regulator [Gemmatimonadaceae bacterium]|nr:sigma-54 dependent transcriptional regulator [Gemmatimonadaceae bacterium]